MENNNDKVIEELSNEGIRTILSAVYGYKQFEKKNLLHVLFMLDILPTENLEGMSATQYVTRLVEEPVVDTYRRASKKFQTLFEDEKD